VLPSKPSACARHSDWPALVIGLFALLFTVMGLFLGKTAAQAKNIGTYAELLGGSVLIGIGLKILWDHGVF
jgi:putative Mn2+ efflux pump MntP